jgi:hypothetical protein
MQFALITLRRVLFAAAIGCAASISVRCQADEPLRWKFTAGEAFDYQMTQDMNMNMDAGPAGQMATTAAQTMNMTWSINRVEDQGDAVIEQKIARIRVKMTAPGGQGFDYDTDSEEPAVGMAAMIAPTFEAMTAGKVTFTMSPRGEVSDVIISDELLAAIKNGPGGEAAGVEQFKSMASQAALTLLENPPKMGETWTTKIAVNSPAGGNQTVETTYTYDGTREADGTTYAVIKPSMTMQLANNPMMEMKMKEQKTDGEVLFDVEAGQLHSMSINHHITLDMVAAGQSMPGTIEQKIDVTVTPREN